MVRFSVDFWWIHPNAPPLLTTWAIFGRWGSCLQWHPCQLCPWQFSNALSLHTLDGAVSRQTAPPCPDSHPSALIPLNFLVLCGKIDQRVSICLSERVSGCSSLADPTDGAVAVFLFTSRASPSAIPGFLPTRSSSFYCTFLLRASLLLTGNITVASCRKESLTCFQAMLFPPHLLHVRGAELRDFVGLKMPETPECFANWLAYTAMPLTM